MKSVKAVTSLLRFRDLRPEDLKTTTTFLNHKERGIKHKNLAWFWYLDVEGDSLDDNAMGECESLFSYSFWTLTIIQFTRSIGSDLINTLSGRRRRF